MVDGGSRAAGRGRTNKTGDMDLRLDSYSLAVRYNRLMHRVRTLEIVLKASHCAVDGVSQCHRSK